MLEYIIQRIKQASEQLISYAEYIEMALYHPTDGYYMKDKVKIGKMGDFITTSNISDIFGRTLSNWYFKKVTENGLSPSICEIGGGNGRFASAFIENWKNISDIPLSYYIVETSPYHRKLQTDLLTEGNITQISHISEIKFFDGLVFSNELFDALPVHVVEKQDGVMYEIMIGFREGELKECRVKLCNPKVIAFINEQKLEIANNQRIEIPIIMEEMVENISKTLQKGLVVTIDYGYTRDEWMEPTRRQGSLRGYYKHQMYNNVLLHPGEMDITSHIHIDALIDIGNKRDLKYLSVSSQDEFLLKAGILKELEDNYDPNPFSELSKRNRAIRSLVMPGLSSYFHVLIQEKATGMRPQDIF